MSSESVSVAALQSDGAFSTSTFVALDEPLPGDLVNFTVCVWVNMAFLRASWTSYFLSYAVPKSDNELIGAFRVRADNAATPVAEEWTLHVEMCKNKYLTRDCARKQLDMARFAPVLRKWLHICGSFWSEGSESEVYRRKAILHVNGEPGRLHEVNISDAGLNKIDTPGSFIIGQEQDLVGGGFSIEQAFSGWFTELNLWRGILDKKQIDEMASCKSNLQGDIISWRNSKWTFNNVNVQEQSLESLCSEPASKNKFIVLQETSFDVMKPICDVVGGFLPTPESAEETDLQQQQILKATEGFLPSDRCHDPQRPFTMLIGIKYHVKAQTWLNVYTGQNASFTPNPIARDAYEANCVYSIKSGLDVSFCSTAFGCGICYMKQHTWFYLKGLCAANVEDVKWYDFYYYLHGLYNGKPHFVGLSNSHLYYDNTTYRWRLQSLRDPTKFLVLNLNMPRTLPFGRQEWILGSDLSACAKKREDIHILTFSRCALKDQFTCNDGNCIPLSERCDTKINCLDQSDEKDCDYLKFSQNYAKQLAPPPEHNANQLSMSTEFSGHTIESQNTVVYLHVNIQALPKIDTVQFSFTVDFFLTLTWHDSRLQFRNLNRDSRLNALGTSDLLDIWTPHLLFINALGSLQSSVDEMTSTWIDRRGSPVMESYEVPNEALIYDGRENPISVSREYYFEFSCNFDLLFYPFDTQHCSMDVEAPWGKGFDLDKDGDGVTVAPSLKLLEYEIINQTVITSASNVSTVGAIVQITIRRRMEYHLSSTFLQTLILIGVGYMSLFFREDNFTDRIMVSITNLVVVATITSSVQENLPKTYYFKLIDWWLMFCINILVFLMAFHTYLAAQMHRMETSLFRNDLKKPRRVCVGNSAEERAKVTRTRKNEDDKIKLSHLTKANRRAKMLIAAAIAIFNVIFWSVAITAYTQHK